ncbi:MAG TPA: cardiolipin synthase [Anaeromyxobacteraceae bacterium]|nr:cardiolipin synthase [Anaeromyxobacteraceae bacterium]
MRPAALALSLLVAALPGRAGAAASLGELAGAIASSGIFWALELGWVVFVALWMLHQRRTPTATLAWMLGLSAIPLLGIPVYLLVGPRRLERKKLRMAIARRAVGPAVAWWEERTAAELPFPGQLARLATALEAWPPETAQEMRLYAGGDETLDDIVEAVRTARRHVHCEYYIFEPDRSGTRLRDALVERARAGVKVRLLVDAVGSARLGRPFLEPLLRAGGRVARFNRPLLGRALRGLANFRTHRKIVVVDGCVGFTGGVNVSDDQSRAARGEAAWRDTHLRLEGAAVHGLQATFLENWTFATRGRDPLRGEALQACFPAAGRGRHWVQVVASGPDQGTHAIEALLFAAVAGARERLWITTPYFVPNEALAAALESAALRGVDVRLLLPVRTDSFVVDAAGRTYHDALADAGVKIHLYGPPMVHAKTLVVDHDLAIVGTANLDNRSLRLNFEVVAAVHGEPLAAELARHFEADLARARPRTGRERDDPLRRRLLASAARLLSPLL